MGDTSSLSDSLIVSTTREKLDYYRKDGIRQIFYVIGGRFTKEGMEALELFQNHFLNETSYFTIVCSKFQEFENKEKCVANRKETDFGEQKYC